LEVSQEHYADILVASATVLEQNAIPALRFAVVPAEAGIQMTLNYTDSGSR